MVSADLSLAQLFGPLSRNGGHHVAHPLRPKGWSTRHFTDRPCRIISDESTRGRLCWDPVLVRRVPLPSGQPWGSLGRGWLSSSAG